MAISQAWVAARYRLVEQLGSGGMGVVWRARDEVLRRDVAVKEVVPPAGLSRAEREELRQRTVREARAAARLSNPHVVQIYDVVHARRRPWIVMEYVPSRSLLQVITQDGPLAPDRVARIGLAVLAALKAAHDAGVLHRDVKPSNVLLADDGRVVLTDFGLAIFEGSDDSLTRPGLILGSAEYISPERARDGICGPEADLWALGATLYAALEGRSPYARATTFGTLTALATEEPDPPHHAGPLEPALNALLCKDPLARATVAETERLLRQASTSTGTSTGTGGSDGAGVSGETAVLVSQAVPVAGSPAAAGDGGVARGSRRRWLAVAAAGTVLIMVAVLLSQLTARGSAGGGADSRRLAGIPGAGASTPTATRPPSQPAGSAASPSSSGVQGSAGRYPTRSPSPPSPRPANAPPAAGRDARSAIQAESYDQQSGVTREPTGDTGGGQDITAIGNRDWVLYQNVNFGSSAPTQFYARVASGAAAGVSGIVEVRLDNPGSAPIGSCSVAGTGGWQSWQTVPANIGAVTGMHDVYVTFTSAQPADWMSMNWVTFGP
jgi:hypothetical protein